MIANRTQELIDALLKEKARLEYQYEHNRFFEDAVSIKHIDEEIAEIQKNCQHAIVRLVDKDKKEYDGCQFCLKNLESQVLGYE